MSTSTTRASLTKPSPSAAPEEAVDVAVLNTNADIIDEFLGCILVNDGVTPATGDLFDGAIVKERTSGIIWEARKNGGGTFDKVYVRYPFQFRGNTGATNYSSGTTYQATGYANYGGGKNSSAANISAGRFVVPVKGIWSLQFRALYAANVTGSRGLSAQYNSVTQNGNIEWSEFLMLATAMSPFDGRMELNIETTLNVGDTVCGALWQNSGGNLACANNGTFTLIEPIQ